MTRGVSEPRAGQFVKLCLLTTAVFLSPDPKKLTPGQALTSSPQNPGSAIKVSANRENLAAYADVHNFGAGRI